MARKSRDDAEKTRQNILKAGLSVFVRDGYEAATLDAIAKEARVSRGAIYWHHNGKINLLEQILTEYQTPLERYLEKPEALSSGLAHLKNAIIETVSNKEFLLLTKAVLTCKWQPQINRRNKELQERLTIKVRSMLHDAQKNGELDSTLNIEQPTKWLQCALGGLFLHGLDHHLFSAMLDSTLGLFEFWIRSKSLGDNPDLLASLG
ncbi:TetR family transcriptional regulator [Pseudomonas sp. Je.1.5.c]|uniref:TetR/AcrR family transcriptional regulator n=1 Tax=Pseudomonas sp. Je.1.5.c TaxID=3142839 RepID=UPI003DA8F969